MIEEVQTLLTDVCNEQLQIAERENKEGPGSPAKMRGVPDGMPMHSPVLSPREDDESAKISSAAVSELGDAAEKAPLAPVTGDSPLSDRMAAMTQAISSTIRKDSLESVEKPLSDISTPHNEQRGSAANDEMKDAFNNISLSIIEKTDSPDKLTETEDMQVRDNETITSS